MTLSNSPVFPQALKTAGIAFATSSQSTQMDPATVAPTTLMTAGTDGSLVTDIEVTAETTVTAEKFVLWRQPGGTGSWFIAGTAVLDAYTQAATDAQGSVKLVTSRLIPTGALRLASGEKLGVTHHVDQQSIVMAEFTDY